MRELHSDYCYVCIHPEHESILEIFTGDQLQKTLEVDERYRIVMVTASREDAMHFVQEAVKKALDKDPELARLKQDVEVLYP